VGAAGVNFRDVLLALGMYAAPSTCRSAPNARGVVVDVGEGVAGVRVGDRLFGYAPGALADDVTVPAAFLARVPDGMTLRGGRGAAGGLPHRVHALHTLAQLRRGETRA